MPTIKLSTEARNEVAGINGIGSSESSTDSPTFCHTTARFRIMKGALPSQAELDNLIPEWARIQGGSPTDILIEKNISHLHVNEIDGNLFFNPVNGIATQSGEASWWVWTGKTTYNPLHRGSHGSPSTVYWLPCMVGTISQRGGSPVGDLVMEDVNIVAGNEYQIGPIEIEIPEVITW